ncbi:MAG: S-layer homology domain-containing protein [Sporomusaceae bacterium]|nr:S-layer homology domain-containing protein [Sporomusaceae bacterium]
MNKRLLKVAVTTALAVAFAVPVFANPFADVPTNSWAYGAVNQLAKEGIVTGYNDGTFKGDKTVTRYEMAQMVAKAMNKTMTASQKAIVDKLALEFGVELGTLGVKIDGMQKQLDNQVKISGDARVRYGEMSGSHDATDFRARVSFDGKISDNLKFNARLSSGNVNADGGTNNMRLDTANVTGNFLGLNTTVGRQDLKLGSGFLADTQMNGASAKFGDLKLFGGTAFSNLAIANWDRVYGAEYNTTVAGAKVTADYLKDQTQKNSIYGVNTSFGIMDGVTANAEYYRNTAASESNTSKAFGVKFNNIGLSATYRNVGQNAFTSFSGLEATPANIQFPAAGFNGFKGMEYQYDTNLDKNATLTVKYQDFKDQNGNKLNNRTSAAVNVKF